MTFKEKNIALHKRFVGRQYEIRQLEEISKTETPAIIVVYGRRRVGKTELLEQTFRQRRIVKFEGREGLDEESQMRALMSDLAGYANEPLLRGVSVSSWQDVFRYIFRYIEKGEWTLYFEEVQWLAQYKTGFISELKFAWDNYFRSNHQLIVILCGSSPSFMINQVAHSKALYNRSQHEIALEPFDLNETKQYLKKMSIRNVMDAYLTVGGIPVYLERLAQQSSVLLSLCKNAFAKNGFFVGEYERIFISSMAENPHYKEIIRFLSKRRFATRQDILGHLKLSSGKNITQVLNDLVICGFIEKYTPYDASNASKLVRYCIVDAYLQFYYKFIEPKKTEIQAGKYNQNPRAALQDDTYAKWLGYAFERFCRRYHHKIAEMLGFSAVNYRAGAFFNREAESLKKGFQIDLIFDRADHVLTVCEIKYSKNKVSSKVISEFETKLERMPNTKNKTIHKVLIASNGVQQSVIDQSYFDCILTLEDFFTGACHST